MGKGNNLIIRLELSSGGKVYLMGNYDQYNVVVTAHGIAYSTTSQLGYMVVACGLSQYSVALFHLINHA